MEKMNRERSLTVSCSTRPRGDQIKLSSDRFRTSKRLYFFHSAWFNCEPLYVLKVYLGVGFQCQSITSCLEEHKAQSLKAGGDPAVHPCKLSLS